MLRLRDSHISAKVIIAFFARLDLKDSTSLSTSIIVVGRLETKPG
jgi:hypothetical protein